MSSFKFRKEIIQYCQRLDQKQFVANHDGNLSVRLLETDRFLATPTARAKADLKTEDLITVDLSGKTRSGKGKIFGEWAFHSEVYKNRPDVKAVVHAHPPYASSLGLAAQSLNVSFWPEGLVSLGRLIPCVSPGSPDFKESMLGLALASKQASACLMQGNGVFAWGSSLEQAYLRLELVEHLAHIYMLAQNHGTLQNLPHNAITLMLEKRKKAGLLSPEETLQ